MRRTWAQGLRRLVPRTLPAWVLIILVGVLLATQTSLFLILTRDRASSNQIVDLYRLNERAFSLVKLMAPLEPPARQKIGSEVADMATALNLSAAPAIAVPVAADDRLSELEDILYSRLTRFGVRDARVRLDAPAPQAPPSALAPAPSAEKAGEDIGDVEANLSEIARDFLHSERYTVSLQFSDGQWLNFVTPVTPVAPLLSRESLPTYLIVSTGVLLLAVWAVWRIAAPYRVLEAAVTRLGENLNAPPLPETGGRDLRSAARALNRMQSRLQEHVEERELLAAALAHDLRTPVTRMRLRLALVESDALKLALEHDLAHVEDTVQSVVGLASLDLNEEPPEAIDLWAMVDAIADDYETAVSISPKPDKGRMICRAAPLGLQRALRNIMDNAVKYGKSASVRIQADTDRLHLLIEDQGEGIAEADRQRVFKPFLRLENSRSRETGGSGLGLTIARSLVRKSGGEIQLEGEEGEGLRVRLTLPRLRG